MAAKVREVSIFRCVAVLLGASALAGAQTTSDRYEGVLNYRITGSSNSSRPADDASIAMTRIEVQRLLLAVAESPRDRQFVMTALQGSDVSLDDLVRNGSLRRQDGRYWLNFGLLTRADQEVVVRAAGVHSRRLADAVLARRSQIEELLRSYGQTGVDAKALAFVALGCLSLDWDGLAFATERGYRAKPPKRRGGRFFVMAEERGGPSLRQIYWGSGNRSYGNFGVISFGDHFGERAEFPDIRRDGSPELRALPAKDFAESIGAIMLALREGPLAAAQMPARNPEPLLTGLESIGYVRKDAGRYLAAIPVITLRDQPMINGLLRIGREVLDEWFRENYAEFRTAMHGISPVRNQVPFAVAFDQLWHYLFGIANRMLVEAGLFADPYVQNAPLQGSVPLVYARGLKLNF